MSISAPVTFDSPDPTLKFTTISALITLLNQLANNVVLPDLNVYVISSTVPGVNDQGKAWVRLDVSGSPQGTYVYKGGFWIREPPTIGGRVAFYIGNPTVDFDDTGKGLKGPGPVAADAYGWALMNGNNGTANLSDKFVVAGRMDNVGITGYSGGWRTNVTGAPLGTGGAAEVTLTSDQVPITAKNAIKSAKYSADGNVQGGALWGDPNGSTDFEILAADAGNDAPDPVPTVPPFYAFALIQFIGATY